MYVMLRRFRQKANCPVYVMLRRFRQKANCPVYVMLRVQVHNHY